jgi:hypothetical protein
MKAEVKKYSIEVIENDKGYSMNRECTGFTALELLGVLEFVQFEILEQMRGNIKPTSITRTIVKKQRITTR